MTVASTLHAPLSRPSLDVPGGHDGHHIAPRIAEPPEPARDPHEPLRDALDLVRHVQVIVPAAVRRQLWTLFFDADDVPLPLMVPLEGIPEVPDEAALGHYGDALAVVATEFGAASVAFVLERPGVASPHVTDRRWADELAELGRGRSFGVRPVLMCSDEGVSVLDTGGGRRGPAAGRQASSSPVRRADIVRRP
ncbi:hypothetical protein [Frigoribacterium sp. VKM Ac-2836]|uniref:hypothetical protein n=1 Tax=Frigoribacterium sp. VKM Ac-2836 TaxID=2739014 RepID=UPI0015662D13|nr:hypothetical protein [Frigoribacterium sp. VKM Ac-2836]NRD26053.1 hypothetical protein [Frigoribacterium sp. VKM Ac-2836]